MADTACESSSAKSPSVALAVALLGLCALPRTALVQEVAVATEAGAGAAAAPEPEAGETFDVWEYRVLGSGVLEQKAIERALYGHLGQGKSIADVETARGALEAAYRNAGYSTVFVDIPEQTVDRGVVRLNVTEGKLDRLRVTGARYFSNRQILERLPALKNGEVPVFPEVQQQLAELNQQTPDRAVTPVLRAGRYPGTVDVELRVMDDLPFHGTVEINDRYTTGTSELRSNVNLSYGNFWQRGHTGSLQYQVAPENPDETEVIAATYVAPLERASTLLALYAVDSSSDVAAIGTLAVLGKGSIFGVRGIRPFDPIGSYFHSATFGIDFKDFDENVLLAEDDGLVTAIKYVNWSANYAFGWTLPKSVSDFGVGAAWGMRGFGNDDAEFEQKRYKARANYMYLVGSGQHSRQVFGNARFVTRFNGQYVTNPLISNEQFSAGGATSVRGYLEAEQLGDLGVSLNLELYTPSLVSGPRVNEIRVFGFFDLASLRLLEPLEGQDASSRLRSAGAGIRFSGFGGLNAELDWALPLTDGSYVLEGDDRVHFRFSYDF